MHPLMREDQIIVHIFLAAADDRVNNARHERTGVPRDTDDLFIVAIIID